jgi:hypothetical protein
MSTWRIKKKKEAERQAAKLKAKEEKKRRRTRSASSAASAGAPRFSPQKDRAYDMLVSKLPSKYYVHSVICSYRDIQKSFISRHHDDFKQELYNYLEDLNEDSMELDDVQIVLVYDTLQ